jgi:hypothetical protein
MRYHILRADFLDIEGRYEEARKTLTDALEIHESPGFHSIKKEIREKIRHLDELEMLS